MNREEMSDNIALASITVGKILNAIGQTPLEHLDRETQDDLVFAGSLIQVAAGSLLIDLFSEDSVARLGLALNFIGYGTFAIQFINDEDDDRKLLVQTMSANLKEVLGNMVLVSDPKAWRRMYVIIGRIMVCLGNFLEAQGRKRLLDAGGDYTLSDPMVTAGTWTEACGMLIILLGNLVETT
ncbi:hypothetical protein M3N64_07605 [Sporolactobacillus sp. CPB3-1]|uniref:Uncharacterized protein n=1 Tax=Sporolactobacillus mangiferae TaxID=2940498 RepID=A0ABT0MAA9_9BACL|nr:hypothetical protein [Sporolactobacillus mangiferae]MCL1631814.1 hypothetical protein [Sporolactobacillus mangiferae]